MYIPKNLEVSNITETHTSILPTIACWCCCQHILPAGNNFPLQEGKSMAVESNLCCCLDFKEAFLTYVI